MDNATENTAANRTALREDGTLDPNATALLEGACFLDGIVERRSGTDSAPAGGPARGPTPPISRVGTAAT